MAYVDWNSRSRKYEIIRWNGVGYEYLPDFENYDDAVKYCNDSGIGFPVRIVDDIEDIEIVSVDDEINNPNDNNLVESFFKHDFDSEFEMWSHIKKYLGKLNFREENVTVECDVPFPLF